MSDNNTPVPVNKQPEKKFEAVASGKLKAKKKTFLGGIFTSEDAAQVKSFVKNDVIIPAIKKVISDTVDTILYPGSRGSRRSPVDRVSYENRYGSRTYDSRDYRRGSENRDKPAATTYGYEDVIFSTRGEAEAVRDRLDEIMDTYEQVSIAALYELSRLPSRYTDNNYGWTNLRDVRIERVRDGFILEMPPVKPLR